MSRSGGGSESNKRVTVDDGGYSSDVQGNKPSLKKSKTTAIDYDVDA